MLKQFFGKLTGISIGKRAAAIVLSAFQLLGVNLSQNSLPVENWSASQTYAEEYAINLAKTPGEDFVILNLADVQMVDWGRALGDARVFRQTLDKLVKETQPDLITLTGDNASGDMSYISLTEILDSYGIPWAPVMGNHDGENTPGEDWCAKTLLSSKYCLFRMGPAGMGHGNYIINITENGKVVHSLFMMDSHSNVTEAGINGGVEDIGCYDHFWSNQLEWYSWAVNGMKNLYGRTVQSTVFMHIPVVEYKDAWKLMGDAATGKIKEEYKETAFGVKLEGICSAADNNGFFDLCKKLGSTKDIVCGHDHINSFSIPYEGIRLSYALKTGTGSYSEDALNGGTVITINSSGETTVTHHCFPL